jgi:hypothetical protein
VAFIDHRTLALPNLGRAKTVHVSRTDRQVRSFFRGGKFERLAALEEKYDPDNLFRLNQNIKPSTNR